VFSFLIIVFFSMMYAVKGGSGNIFKNWDSIRARNEVLDRLLDGKVLSTLLIWSVVTALTANGWEGAKWAAAWLLAVTPSMGEEHGAIGRLKKSWGPYINKGFGRSYGIKKGLQRGVWMGACMAVATGFTPFLWASLLFVPTVFIGQEINWHLYQTNGWRAAEPLIGAVVFGVPAALYFYAL
jgi:hypothetical protein